MEDNNEVVITTASHLAETVASAYRNGWADHAATVEAKLRDILAKRKAVSAVYSQTIGIEEAIKELGLIK